MRTSLFDIPGLGGILQARQLNQQQEMGALSQAQAIQGILSSVQQQQARQQALQESQAIKGALSGATGPDDAIGRLMKIGSPAGLELAAKLKGLMPRVDPTPIGAGGLRMPDGTIIAPAQKPSEPKAPPSRKYPVNEGGKVFEVTEEMQKDGKWKELGRRPLKDPTIVMPGQPKTPIVQTDENGNVRMYDHQGNLVKDLGQVGKRAPTVAKADEAKKKTVRELQSAISELEAISADGGLIDQSTGSGIGAAVDYGASVFGKATPGAVAVGKVQPIFDLVLKMVPRFEGPQSDKDTASYKEAAGNLANPKIPTPQKKEAAREILRLMKKRAGQFTQQGAEDAGAGSPNVDALLDKYK